jgi:hypothetical protein
VPVELAAPPLEVVDDEPPVLDPPDAADDDAGSRSVWRPVSRLRNAVTSPPVDTIPATVQPSAAFSVSFVASAAGS